MIQYTILHMPSAEHGSRCAAESLTPHRKPCREAVFFYAACRSWLCDFAHCADFRALPSSRSNENSPRRPAAGWFTDEGHGSIHAFADRIVDVVSGFSPPGGANSSPSFWYAM